MTMHVCATAGLQRVDDLDDCGPPSEWACHDALTCLAINIRSGAVLCAAFKHGQFFGSEGAWYPGCQRPIWRQRS